MKDLMSNDPTTAMGHLMDIVEMKGVGLTRSTIAKLIVTNDCAFMRNEGIRPDVNAYVHADERAKEAIRAITGSTLTDKITRNRVAGGLTRKTEMGTLMHYVFKEYSYFIGKYAHVAEVEKCISNVIQIPESHIEVVPLSYYRDLISIVAVLFVISFVFLLFEPFLKDGERPRARMRRSGLHRARNSGPRLPIIPE
jgi:hypothetical protein